MLVDSKEILNYCKVQKAVFEMLKIPGEFNEGVLTGINLVKTWIEISEKKSDAKV